MGAASDDPLVATIEVLVLDEVVGSLPRADIGTQDTSYLVDVDLTAEEYEHGQGVVRIRDPESESVIASAPVTLRVTNGGCG